MICIASIRIHWFELVKFKGGPSYLFGFIHVFAENANFITRGQAGIITVLVADIWGIHIEERSIVVQQESIDDYHP